jgi:hypothetical protein
MYTNSSLLNVPQLDREGLMKLYSQFLVGKKHPEVIAEYGFHPELAESEYQRFVRLAEYNIDSLQKKSF